LKTTYGQQWKDGFGLIGRTGIHATRSPVMLFEAEAILLFHFSAKATLPDDKLFSTFKLFVQTRKATDGTSSRPDSFLPYSASER
jgi:hypothetical protein